MFLDGSHTIVVTATMHVDGSHTMVVTATMHPTPLSHTLRGRLLQHWVPSPVHCPPGEPTVLLLVSRTQGLVPCYYRYAYHTSDVHTQCL